MVHKLQAWPKTSIISAMGHRDTMDKKENVIEYKQAPTPNQTSINLCGVECVQDPNEKNCCRDMYDCVDWRHCGGVTLHVLIWISVAIGAIYLIATTQQVLYTCRVLSNFARHDCLNRNNTDVVRYAFGFCLLIFAIVKSVMVFVRLCCRRNDTLKCINGTPNDTMCQYIAAWSFLLGTLIVLFVFIYCLQFMENCHIRDDEDSPESKACHAYKETDLGGYLAGAVLSGFLFCVMIAIGPSVYFKWMDPKTRGPTDCGCDGCFL